MMYHISALGAHSPLKGADFLMLALSTSNKKLKNYIIHTKIYATAGDPYGQDSKQ